MKIEKYISDQKFVFPFKNIKDLEEAFKKNPKNFGKNKKDGDKIIVNFDCDPDFEKLRLLVILSPIFISIFDSEDKEEEILFFKRNLTRSHFKYGLYENFFQGFDFEKYQIFYKNHKREEDIILNPDMTIDFIINPMEDKYILSLVAMILALIVDDKERKNLLDYFAKMRNDIVINGRRSILANGIQAFYLSKYVVVWALDLYKIIEKNHPDFYKYIVPIYELSNNLKTPALF
jgi:hypothetical protein